MSKGRPSMTEARGVYTTLQVKFSQAVDRYPVTEKEVGGYKGKLEQGPITGRLRFVDMTSGGSTLPSLIFADETGRMMAMTCDAFRNATLWGHLDMVGGYIEGTFDVVTYELRGGNAWGYYIQVRKPADKA